MHPYIAVPATCALVYRAWSRKSLTPAGIVTAALTAIVHAIHPWSIFFALLVVFFLAGTAVTKVMLLIQNCVPEGRTATDVMSGQTRRESPSNTCFLRSFRRRRCSNTYPSLSQLNRGLGTHTSSLSATAGKGKGLCFRARLLGLRQ